MFVQTRCSPGRSQVVASGCNTPVSSTKSITNRLPGSTPGSEGDSSLGSGCSSPYADSVHGWKHCSCSAGSGSCSTPYVTPGSCTEDMIARLPESIPGSVDGSSPASERSPCADSVLGWKCCSSDSGSCNAPSEDELQSSVFIHMPWTSGVVSKVSSRALLSGLVQNTSHLAASMVHARRGTAPVQVNTLEAY